MIMYPPMGIRFLGSMVNVTLTISAAIVESDKTTDGTANESGVNVKVKPDTWLSVPIKS